MSTHSSELTLLASWHVAYLCDHVRPRMPATPFARVRLYGLMPSYRMTGPAWLTLEDTHSLEPLPHSPCPTLAPGYTNTNTFLQVISLSIQLVLMLAWVQPKISARIFQLRSCLWEAIMYVGGGTQQRYTALVSPYGSGFAENLEQAVQPCTAVQLHMPLSAL